jgi:lysine/ornithine N-monooxygenase
LAFAKTNPNLRSPCRKVTAIKRQSVADRKRKWQTTYGEIRKQTIKHLYGTNYKRTVHRKTHSRKKELTGTMPRQNFRQQHCHDPRRKTKENMP